MIATLRFIVSVIVLKIPRSIFRHRISHTTTESIGAVFVIFKSLRIHCLAFLVADFLAVFAVEIPVGIDTAHIIHCRGNRYFDTGIERRCIDCHAAPAADTDNTDFLRVNRIL